MRFQAARGVVADYRKQNGKPTLTANGTDKAGSATRPFQGERRGHASASMTWLRKVPNLGRAYDPAAHCGMVGA